jgi:hypothetical protein
MPFRVCVTVHQQQRARVGPSPRRPSHTRTRPGGTRCSALAVELRVAEAAERLREQVQRLSAEVPALKHKAEPHVMWR